MVSLEDHWPYQFTLTDKGHCSATGTVSSSNTSFPIQKSLTNWICQDRGRLVGENGNVQGRPLGKPISPVYIKCQGVLATHYGLSSHKDKQTCQLAHLLLDNHLVVVNNTLGTDFLLSLKITHFYWFTLSGREYLTTSYAPTPHW